MLVHDRGPGGGAKCAADSASRKGKTGGGGEEGVRRSELDECYNERERSGLADAREHVVADLRLGQGGGDGGVADAGDEEEEEGDDDGGLEVFVLCGVESGEGSASYQYEEMIETHVMGMETNRVVRLKASWRIEIFQALVSNPRCKTKAGVMLLTAL